MSEFDFGKSSLITPRHQLFTEYRSAFLSHDFQKVTALRQRAKDIEAARFEEGRTKRQKAWLRHYHPIKYFWLIASEYWFGLVSGKPRSL